MSCLSIETRQSVLLPWIFDQPDVGTEDDQRVIGFAEERRDSSANTLQVKIEWSMDGENDESLVHLPFIDDPGSLGSTLWPSGIATAILCMSPTIKEFMQSRSVLELGCGLGLTGLAASKHSPKVLLTDNDESAIQALRATAEEHYKSAADHAIDVSLLDWRDKHVVKEKFPCIVATDVAYYYYVLRPLMDTVRAHLQATDSFMLTVGQGNRNSQWDLHNNLLHGCYNQLTDQHEDPWPGSTQTLLYKLQMNDWKRVGDSSVAETTDGALPIAALLYQTEGHRLSPLTKWDHVASAADIAEMSKTF
ncbi:hypothetical protein MPSEU_000236200 [Mayamaea pseudoterrestris]|nr:hypothetical protein MPSEU_000236200 [Mayamaea pseudoterrestris]